MRHKADPDQYDQLFRQHAERFANRQRNYIEPIRVLHKSDLSNAGYTEINPIWANIDDCVLLAVGSPELASVKN
jgi:hypothetical protein